MGARQENETEAVGTRGNAGTSGAGSGKERNGSERVNRARSLPGDDLSALPDVASSLLADTIFRNLIRNR